MHERNITTERDGKHFIQSSVEPGKILEGPFNTAEEALSRSKKRSREFVDPSESDILSRIEEEQARRVEDRVKTETFNRQSIAKQGFDQAAMGLRDTLGMFGIRGPIESAGEALDLPPLEDIEPQNVVQQAARTAGQTLPLAPIMGGGASLVKESAQTGGKLLTRIFRGGKNVIADIGQRFLASPSGFIAGETALGGAAGVGGFYAKTAFPDSDAAQFIGEVIGGTAPSALPVNLLRRGAGFARKGLTKFRRGIGRAEQRVQRAVPEDARIKAVGQLEEPTTVDPQTGRPTLSLAQRTEEQGLLSLERDILKSSDELTRASDEQIARANQVIQESAGEIGSGTPAAAQAYMRGLIETRLRIAAQRADERISDLGPKATREQANRVAAQEVNNAVEAAAAQRRALFEAIPQDELAPIEQGSSAFDALIGRGPPVELPTGDTITRLPLSQMKDIPVEARKFLNKKSPVYLGKTSLEDATKKGETTIRELVGLKNTLAETSRKARSAGDLNMARIADQISDAIEVDISLSGGEASEAVESALSFSSEFRKRFKQGTVGKLTGMAREGGRRIPESLTLEQSIGATGPKGRQAMDDILSALDTGSDTFISAASDYLKNRFLRSATISGQINATAARRFMDTHDELLTRLPELREEFVQATQSGRLSKALSVVSDPRKSKAALFIQRGPEEAFNDLSQLTPDKAGFEAQKLINMVARDQTGEATSGLKTGLVEFLMKRSGQRDISGRPFVSGFAMKDALENPSIRRVLSKVLNKDEATRLNLITKDFMRLEKSVKARGSEEGVLGDVPGNVLSTLARLAGAASGRNIAAKLGFGGTVQIPGIMSNRFAQMTAAGIQDPARRVLMDSVQDEKLFKELLLANVSKSGDLPKSALRRFGLWASGTLVTRTSLAAARSEIEDTADIAP